MTELKFQGPFTVMPYQPCVLLKVNSFKMSVFLEVMDGWLIQSTYSLY